MSSPSILYLIPVPIAENALHTLPGEVLSITAELRHYVVENTRTARRFLRSMHASLTLEDIVFSEIDKHQGIDAPTLQQWMKEGRAIGVMSEAGCPGVADPGAEIVQIAHQLGATVKPLTGPSSIMLALMASGLNGQSFCFRGYLPVKEPQRSQTIKGLEQSSAKEQQTQIFIETPYRNNVLLDELCKHCASTTLLCVAQNITSKDEIIKTKTIADWKKQKTVLEKSPAVFLMLGQ